MLSHDGLAHAIGTCFLGNEFTVVYQSTSDHHLGVCPNISDFRISTASFPQKKKKYTALSLRC